MEKFKLSKTAIESIEYFFNSVTDEKRELDGILEAYNVICSTPDLEDRMDEVSTPLYYYRQLLKACCIQDE